MATNPETRTDAGGELPLDNLEIARGTPGRPIMEIAADLGLRNDQVEPYGHGVAKVDLAAMGDPSPSRRGRYVVVSAITPTPLGEGKTTTAIGLSQALCRLGHKATVTLRQPSLGPTLGIKGGAAGGGYSQVIPMERINLHLTGDIHAVTAAHNLLAAMVDNHLYQGREPRLDAARISWRRVVDINDRALRQIVIGLGSRGDGIPRQTGFDITAASEVMAVLALADSLADLRQRLGRITIGRGTDGRPVTAEQIGAAGAMTVLLRDALRPNLLQTLEHTPAMMHTGPFGNIAHGNSSIVADHVALTYSDYVVTEAGFGADMGAERFFNIKCRASGLTPHAAVLVATVRGLKFHSGRHRVVAGRPLPESMLRESPDDVWAGGANLRRQIENIRIHGVTPVVAVNTFPTDYASEHAAILAIAREFGVRACLCSHVQDGGEGALELAEAVAEAAAQPVDFRLLYADALAPREKIARIAQRIYGADGVACSPLAEEQLAQIIAEGHDTLPVCIAKTHLSLSADPKLQGAPTGWTLPVREVRAATGAGFLYALCGDIRTMPGLGTTPAAYGMDVDDQERLHGLF